MPTQTHRPAGPTGQRNGMTIDQYMHWLTSEITDVRRDAMGSAGSIPRQAPVGRDRTDKRAKARTPARKTPGSETLNENQRWIMTQLRAADNHQLTRPSIQRLSKESGHRL